MINYISADRLDIYEKQLKVNNSQVMKAYHWNKALSGAMIPVMQCLEVTLRNAIDQSIQMTPNMGAHDLWEANHNWILNLTHYMGNKACKNKRKRYREAKKPSDKQDDKGYLLNNYGKRILEKLIFEETTIEQVKKKILKDGKVITSARIISSLNLGFWTLLLSNKYEDNESKMLLWPNLTNIVFPNAPEHYTISDIRQRIDKIRELRNRLSHHEALWKFHYNIPDTNKPDYTNPVYGTNASITLLKKHYDDIIDIIGWIDLDRKNNFIKHYANTRFNALCSIDGLNSYIEPDKINNKIIVNQDEIGINKILKKISKGEFINIIKDGKTILTIGPDSSISNLN